MAQADHGIAVTLAEARVPHRSRHYGPYRHLAPLLSRFPELDRADPRRAAMRGELAVGFLPVVRRIAHRYTGHGEPIDDLMQAGAIGLLRAIDRFAPPPGTEDLVSAFLGFADPTVSGEIRRHFRDRTWSVRVPRRLKDLQVPMRQAEAELASELRRSPRPSEIAARLGVGIAEVRAARSAQWAYRPASLDVPRSPDGQALLDTVGRLDPGMFRAEHRRELQLGLDGLCERDRTMMTMRFFGDMTQTQIAGELGISQMQVSRLLQQTLATLRQKMDLVL
ncbi:MAG TPA: sigma-70 family RNA polymerase sigma factor [Pseudonocardia sp.]|nr:sigma-70 family RNA polymerase sigma factor [Pseudonocardia sp.]